MLQSNQVEGETLVVASQATNFAVRLHELVLFVHEDSTLASGSLMYRTKP